MRQKLTHISLSFLKKLLEKVPAAGGVVTRFLLIIIIPFMAIWKLVRPLVIQIYKYGVLARQKTKIFFHAQHKLLAIVSHKSTVHFFIVVLAVGILYSNFAQAHEVRAEQFIQGSVVDNIINPGNQTTVNTDLGKNAHNSYIDTSATVQAKTRIDNSIDISGANQAVLARAQSGGTTTGAVASTTSIDPNSLGTSGGQIEKYTVLGGETISTIAAKFGVTTKTILTANGLTEDAAKKVKNGDQIYILPISGVAHTVASGENAESIASKYGAKAEDIISFNKLLNGTDLAAGTEIIVPGGKRDIAPAPQVAAAPAATTRFSGVSRSGGNSAATITAPTTPNAAPSGGKLQWPTTTRRVSQYFGYRHTGLDIDGEFGDPIYAANGGRVISAGWGGAYGNMVVIDHGGGMTTRYAHLQKLFVGSGQNVTRGQSLGQEGSTGRSTGSHLHFEVMINGRFVNPFGYY